MFDMTKCKEGDKLVTRDGRTVVYCNRRYGYTRYPYVVCVSHIQKYITYTRDGECKRGEVTDHNIIAFAPGYGPEAEAAKERERLKDLLIEYTKWLTFDEAKCEQYERITEEIVKYVDKFLEMQEKNNV